MPAPRQAVLAAASHAEAAVAAAVADDVADDADTLARQIMSAADMHWTNGSLSIVELQTFLGPGTAAGKRFEGPPFIDLP